MAAHAAPAATDNHMLRLGREGETLFQPRVMEICMLLMRNRTLRYNEMRRLLGEISTRTLALKLKFLQHRRIIDRRPAPGTAAGIEYTLTHMGRQLCSLVLPALLHLTSNDDAEAMDGEAGLTEGQAAGDDAPVDAAVQGRLSTPPNGGRLSAPPRLLREMEARFIGS